jgi:hypothetical protein
MNAEMFIIVDDEFKESSIISWAFSREEAEVFRREYENDRIYFPKEYNKLDPSIKDISIKGKNAKLKIIALITPPDNLNHKP